MLKLKYIIILIFCFFIDEVNAQFTLQPIKVSAVYLRKDSLIEITYKNSNITPILLWVGDFVIDKLNRNSNYHYLARPIKSEIYLTEHTDIEFLNYTTSDTNTLLTLSNYKYLDVDSFFKVQIVVKDSALIKKIKKNKIYFHCSLIDCENLTQYHNRTVNVSNDYKITDTKFYYSYPIIKFDSIHWSIDNKRSIMNQTNSDLPFFLRVFKG